MKNKNTWLLYAFILSFFACNPQEDKLETFVPNTDSEVVRSLNPRAIPDADDPNSVTFTMDDVNGLVGVWEINGTLYPRNQVVRYYDFPGEYEVKAFAYNRNGVFPALTIPVEITTTSPYVCVNTDYLYLSGGCDAPEEKTWILDSSSKGYYGLGEYGANEPNWWEADPGSHNGVYDDEITFVLDQYKTYIHETHGTSGLDSEEVDFPAYTATWDLYTEDDITYIQLSGQGFFPPRSSDSQGNSKYVLLELTEDILRVKIQVGNEAEGQAWFYRFVPKTN
ncbi:MAG: hypothetical protein LUG18_14195 [Candidatus Azobacteroides sp.]|nr:hypothetical protein [Candidatus Azobacteroides sp.]